MEPAVSSVSWATILGGALAAVAVSFILLILGSALELSSVSPWSYTNNSIAAFSIKTVVWLIVMQWISSGLGGYLTGRLRVKWMDTHADEVFFRDTAHGFLTWAAATVLTVAFLASATASVVSGGVHAGAAVASGAAVGAASQAGTKDPHQNSNDPLAYYVDVLFRSNKPNPNVSNQEALGETSRILFNGMKNDGLPEADKNYLAQLVSAHTGVDQAEASRRVDTAIAQMHDAKQKALDEAEAARKAALKVSIYIFLSMLIGAFIASVAAGLGGKHRDEY